MHSCASAVFAYLPCILRALSSLQAASSRHSDPASLSRLFLLMTHPLCLPCSSHALAQSASAARFCSRTTTWWRSWRSLTARGSPSVWCMPAEQLPRVSSRWVWGESCGSRDDTHACARLCPCMHKHQQPRYSGMGACLWRMGIAPRIEVTLGIMLMLRTCMTLAPLCWPWPHAPFLNLVHCTFDRTVGPLSLLLPSPRLHAYRVRKPITPQPAP